MDLVQITQEIISKLNQITFDEYALGDESYQESSKNKISSIISEKICDLNPNQKKRIEDEFLGLGPIETLLLQEDITEIIINGPTFIFIEKCGTLSQHSDFFFSCFTYEKFVQRLCEESNCILNLENPFADGQYKNFRVTLTDRIITKSNTIVNIRRHPKSAWTLDKLIQNNWCDPTLFACFSTLIQQKKNFLIVGPTGTGKTSVLNSLLQLTTKHDRSVIIEDTPEIMLSNAVSIKLLTQQDPNKLRSEITQAELVKRSLRLRPDRIVMGEIRGPEAKDFLMALSTGHLGSFGTLHANDPHQALIRLEMLIQMGAPHWSLSAIRKLIFLSLDMILVITKSDSGKRVFGGAYQIDSLEENGFLLEKKF